MESRKLREDQTSGLSSVLRINRILVVNLAVADLLMGIYLVMLGGAGAVYDGIFCAYRFLWLSSSTCSTMGILVVVSSQVSVLMLVLLTGVRLYGVLKPFVVDKPKIFHIILAIIFAWVSSFILATLPLVPQLQFIFVEEAFLYGNPFFGNAVVNIETAKNWTFKIITFDPHFANVSNDVMENIRSASSWWTLQSIIEQSSTTAAYFKPDYFLGYYSANSVCIPRLFVTTEDKSWRFSISITIINLISFLFVVVCYLIMASSIERSKRQCGRSDLRNMQKKIFRILATDFCCWVPISIMAILSISGMPIPDTAYSFAAIILLPINSALNPFLYSNLIDTLCAKLTPKLAVVRNWRKAKDFIISSAVSCRNTSTASLAAFFTPNKKRQQSTAATSTTS